MIGETVSHYRVLSELGSGGMGVVYEAEDMNLGRRVALKFLPAALGTTEAFERFKREARAASALNHPHICVVHALGEHAGKPFIVMERMQGQTLGHLASGRPLPVERVVDLGAQIADALAAAHAAGIVHRDLKPANVFVTERGDAKLLDFGLAKMAPRESVTPVDETAEMADPLTSPGMLLGTVAYMSPEQCRGEELDARTDLFSLGVVLYQMATGRQPFAGRTHAEIFSGILGRAPVSPASLSRDVPPELERVILKALEKDRELRYQHASELRADLLRVGRDRGSDRGSAPAAGLRPGRRGLAAVAGAVALALLMGGAWLARHGGRPATEASPAAPAGPRRIAVLPFENQGPAEEGYFADGMTDEVRSRLVGLPGLAVIASSNSSTYRGTTKRAEQIGKELGVGYLLMAKVRWEKSGKASRIRVTPELVEIGGGGAPTTRWQKAFDADMKDVFAVQGEIATRVAQSLQVVLSGAQRGRLEARPTSDLAAYDAYLKAVEIEKTLGPRAATPAWEQAVALDPGFALAWARFSLNRSWLFSTDPADAEDLARTAGNAAERALAVAPDLPLAHCALGLYRLWVTKDHRAALEEYSRALRLAPEDPDVIGLLAHAFGQLGRLEEAILHLQRARDLEPSSKTEASLGRHLLLLRRTAEAREALDRALALAPDAEGIQLEAMTYLQEGDLAGARAVIAAAPKELPPTAIAAQFGYAEDLDWVLDDPMRELLLRMTPTAFNDDRPSWGIALAQAASRRGDQAKVLEFAEEVRKAFVTRLAGAPKEAGCHPMPYGLALAYLGRKAEAVRAVGPCGALGAFRAPGLGAYMQHQAARVYMLAGDHEKALDLLVPLLRVPYWLTPAWLRIDPNFDPLRGNPRFAKLAQAK